jgi:hypothetical protein
MRRFQITKNSFSSLHQNISAKRTKTQRVEHLPPPTHQYYYLPQQQHQNPIQNLPPLLREAVAASPPQYQQQFFQNQHHQHQQNRFVVGNYHQQQQNTSSPADQLHDSLQAEQQNFHTKGFRALHKHHRNFVFGCIVVALLVPDMFDNHLGETMRYQLLIKDQKDQLELTAAATKEKETKSEKKK